MATQKKIAGGGLKPNSRRTDGENIFLIVIIYGLFLITIKKGNRQIARRDILLIVIKNAPYMITISKKEIGEIESF